MGAINLRQSTQRCSYFLPHARWRSNAVCTILHQPYLVAIGEQHWEHRLVSFDVHLEDCHYVWAVNVVSDASAQRQCHYNLTPLHFYYTLWGMHGSKHQAHQESSVGRRASSQRIHAQSTGARHPRPAQRDQRRRKASTINHPMGWSPPPPITPPAKMNGFLPKGQKAIHTTQTVAF